MDFSLTEEQQLIVQTTRDFVVNELYPHEAEVEATGVLRPELRDAIKAKAIEAGLYAANMPAEVGGAGLDTLTWLLTNASWAAPTMRCIGRAWRALRTS
jgi:acyl-CoA dehydrogenase